MPQINNEYYQPLYYRKFGGGPAVVLLHGFPADGDLWRHIWPGLSKSFTLIIPDLPGSGKSVFNGTTLSIEDMAEAIALILEQEHIDKAVIAGHSMGGYVALALAELYPTKLMGLSLVHSIASADDEEKKQARQKAIELIQKGGKDAFVRQMVPNLFGPPFAAIHKDIVEGQTDHALLLENKSMINFYSAMMKRPGREQVLKTASFPVQWVCGREDKVIPFEKSLGQSYWADIDFVSVYKDCGHMSMLEATENLLTDLMIYSKYCCSLVG